MIKERKGKIKAQIQIAEKCCLQEMSRAEQMLERILSVDEMEKIAGIYGVEVPDNPYKEVVMTVHAVAVSNEPKPIAVPQVEKVTEIVREVEPMIIASELTIEPVIKIADVVADETISSEIAEILVDVLQSIGAENLELPKTLVEYP